MRAQCMPQVMLRALEHNQKSLGSEVALYTRSNHQHLMASSKHYLGTLLTTQVSVPRSPLLACLRSVLALPRVRIGLHSSHVPW